MPVNSDTPCFHCGLPVADSRIERDAHSFCCQGCAGAYELISGSGMLDYYEFRTEYAPRPEDTTSEEIWDLIERTALESGANSPSTTTPRSSAPGNSDTQAGDSEPVATADFLIEGIHCSSCIWLNETMLRSIPGVAAASGNLATNRIKLSWKPSIVPLKELARRIERLGYRLLPLRHSEASESQKSYARNLLKKMVVAGFFAGNIMLVSVSLYAGYFGTMDRFTRNFFHFVSFAFATPVLLYSASVFFRTAFASLRHGVLSMDLLTSAGLSIAYIYSLYAAFFEAGEVYFDSVCFVTFAVLAGRYLESRLKLRSLYLIDNLQQAESPFARKLDQSGTQEIVAAETLRPGDRILLRPGESLPCDATLLSDSCEVEQSLLTGEFEPVVKQRGDLLLSGIRAIGEMELEIERSGETSALRQIQDMAASSLNDSPASQKYAETAGRWFVALVLAASVGAFFYHLSLSGISHAIVVTVTLLIVACPCALNLAIPTAFIAGIQRSYSSGILFRSGQHLETIARAKSLVFDKTGTLTRGAMEIVEEYFSGTGAYSDDQLRSLARTIESKSGVHHPVVSAFEKSYSHLPSFPFSSEVSVRYIPGKGVQLLADERPVWLVGSFAWIEEELLRRSQELSPKMKDFRRLCEQSMRSAVVLAHCESVDHIQPLAAFSLEDALREDATSVVGHLGNKMHLTILSGDSSEHVRRLAHQLQINEFRAEQSPEQKRDFVRQSTQREITLMVGDGINDSVALAAADTGISFAGGASLALHHSDVLLLNNRLGDLEKMISIARSTRRKILQNLILAFAYNGFLIPVAFAGFISPFLGAVFMSLSSITVIVNSLFAGRKATIR